MRYRNCVKIMAVVILLSFLRFPAFAEQPTAREMNSTEGLTKFYSDTEVSQLIEELSEAAEEAIERATAQAAKAAALASLEREAAAVSAAKLWHTEYRNAKSAGVRSAVIAGVICFFGGLAVGAGTIAIIGGR
jgi:hypothetical protein